MSSIFGGRTTSSSSSNPGQIDGDFYVIGASYLAGNVTIDGNSKISEGVTTNGEVLFESGATLESGGSFGDTDIGEEVSTNINVLASSLYDSNGQLGHQVNNGFHYTTPAPVVSIANNTVTQLGVITLPKGYWRVEATVVNIFLGQNSAYGGNTGTFTFWIGTSPSFTPGSESSYLISQTDPVGVAYYTQLPATTYVFAHVTSTGSTSAYLYAYANISGSFQWSVSYIPLVSSPLAPDSIGMTATLLY